MKPNLWNLLLLLLFVPAAPLLAAKPPNVVIIVADDLGYADVLFHPTPAPGVSTPHLAALAKQSMICRQGYVSGNVCSPTRAGLMTGRYQQRFGLYTGGEAGSGLPMEVSIFPQFLKPAGYRTAQFGKWHLGPDPAWSPALRGFDEVFGFLGRGAHDYFKLNDPDDPIYRGTEVVAESGYLTDRLGEETAAFIRRQSDQPFLAYLAFNAVHAPLQAPPEEIAKFDSGDPERNTLLAMGKRLDDAVGRVLAALEETGARSNTMIFFLSDNGGPLAQGAVNTPLRGGKHTDYEGGIRVPFLISWPARITPGTWEHPVIALDILPTVLAAADVSPPPGTEFDGTNLIPWLTGERPPESRDLFWSSGSEGGWWAVRSGDWKLVSEKGQIALFDLKQDPSEKQDLSSKFPDQRIALQARLDAWLTTMADPVKAGAKRTGLEPSSGMPTKKRRDKEKKGDPASGPPS